MGVADHDPSRWGRAGAWAVESREAALDLDLDLPGGGAGIQVDPCLELLIVWGPDGQAEHGDRGLDQVPPAVDDLRRRIHSDRGRADGDSLP